MQNSLDAKTMMQSGVPIIPAEKARPKTSEKRKALGKAIFPYLLLLPACACFFTFNFFPFFRTVLLSFFLTDNEGNAKAFRGLKNYILFFTSADYQQVIRNTFVFAAVVIAASMLIGFITANLANVKGRAFRVFPPLFALPIAAAAGTFSLLFEKIFDPTMGIVNKLFHLNIMWFSDPHLALFTVAGITVWMMSGSNFLYLYAGLKSIPKELIESAEIDGAGGLVKLFAIVVPMPFTDALFCADYRYHRRVPVLHADSDYHAGRTGHCHGRHRLQHLPRRVFQLPLRVSRGAVGCSVRHRPRHHSDSVRQ